MTTAIPAYATRDVAARMASNLIERRLEAGVILITSAIRRCVAPIDAVLIAGFHLSFRAEAIAAPLIGAGPGYVTGKGARRLPDSAKWLTEEGV